MNDGGDEVGEDAGAIADLIAVNFAFPGGAAVDELVAEHVEAVKEDAGEGDGIFGGERVLGGAFAAVESPFPFCFAEPAVVEVPEVVADVGVINKEPDFAGVVGPDHVVDEIFVIDPDEAGKEVLKGSFFAKVAPFPDFLGINRIESDPEEDEFGVELVGLIGGF